MPANSTGLKRFQVPRLRKSILVRPRVLQILEDAVDFPLTIVKAGPGYGKTTAVSSFVRSSEKTSIWFTVTEDERNPTTFITQFLTALFPNGSDESETQAITEAIQHPLTSLASADSALQLVSQHFVDETFIVLDDFHLLTQSKTISNWVDRWLKGLPFHVHVILITRTEPDELTSVHELESKGDILWIREQDLLFTEAEVIALFGGQNSVEQGVREFRGVKEVNVSFDTKYISDKSGGLAIVLTMLQREWQQHASWQRIRELLSGRSTLREQIGRILLSECGEEQIWFLAVCSFLTSLTPDSCNYVTQTSLAKDHLRWHEKRGLLLATGAVDTYALHPFVREYLQSQLDGAEKRTAVWRTVEWFYKTGDVARALGYVFYLPDESEAVNELLKHIPSFLAKGYISTVESWLSQLSSPILERHPELLLIQAEIARAKNQFPTARRFYHAAREIFSETGQPCGVGDALQGLARLFLDTIQPSLAKEYLRLARQNSRNLTAENRLKLIRLEYENAVNRGLLQRALRLEHDLVKSGDMMEAIEHENTDVRLLLRTGQLTKAIAALVHRAHFDRALPHRLALSHREATLILSLLYSMVGNTGDAADAARAGFDVGHQLQSPFVRAVGSIRLGHALHLQNPLSDQALVSYQSALRDMDEMGSVRGKSEALLGMTLVLGYQGQFDRASVAAREGMRIARDVEDAWMENLVRLGYGQVCAVEGEWEDAVPVLGQAINVFTKCGDRFLQATGLLWRSYVYFKINDERFVDDLSSAYGLAEDGDFLYLFERPTLFGFRDMQKLVPVLQACCQREPSLPFIPRLLKHLCPVHVEVHPGFTLRLQTLGEFRLWRGFEEIPRKAWTREKARQLLQYLVTQGDVQRHREEIAADVWGVDDPDVAERDFKVALNGLKTVLEPNSNQRGTSVFVVREGGFYRLLKNGFVFVDRDEFERLVHSSLQLAGVEKKRRLAAAIELYKGDYLPDARYALWSLAERDRIRSLFMRTCKVYAELLLQNDDLEEVIHIAERMLHFDATCEEAYVLLLEAYGRQKKRHMVVQVYQTCVHTLKRELNAPPLRETTQLYEQLLRIN